MTAGRIFYILILSLFVIQFLFTFRVLYPAWANFSKSKYKINKIQNNTLKQLYIFWICCNTDIIGFAVLIIIGFCMFFVM